MGTSKLSGKPDKILGVTCDGLASHPGGVAILLVTSCTETGISSSSNGPPGGVLRYISDGDVRSPFLGLKFAI